MPFGTFLAFRSKIRGSLLRDPDWKRASPKISMIRAYILCFAGIVGDRIIPDMTFVSQRIGTEPLNDISGWANWAVPLMVVEVLMQIPSFRKNSHRSS